MKLKVLTDNTSLEGFYSIHGFSVLVDFDKKILFDVGPNDAFLKNAKILGEDFSDVDTVVLSHGHWDHGDGLFYLSDKELILHPDCFIARHRKRNNTHVGISLNKDELSKKFKITESRKPLWISENMVFLGEIPRLNDFESKQSPFRLPNGLPDFVPDDSAIAIISKKGLIVLSGCAHSGICNTVEHAKKVSKINTVYAVIGGFHLKEIDKITINTIEYLKSENIEFLGPTHCTSFKVCDEFAKSFNLLKLAAGAVIEL